MRCVADLFLPHTDVVVTVENQPQDFHVLAGGQVLRDGSVVGARLRDTGGTVHTVDLLPPGIVVFETGVKGDLELD